MIKNLIQFDKLQWEQSAKGAEQKVYTDGKQRIRLLKFSDSYSETDWCTNGHIGLVLKGEMKISFNGRVESYKQGDGLWIEAGASSRHKAIIEKGKYTELIMFEADE